MKDKYEPDNEWMDAPLGKPQSEKKQCPTCGNVFEVHFMNKKRIAELEEQLRWIPVSEGLPDGNFDVLVMYDGDPRVAHYVCSPYLWYASYGDEFEMNLDDSKVTHWKPIQLPEAE